VSENLDRFDFDGIENLRARLAAHIRLYDLQLPCKYEEIAELLGIPDNPNLRHLTDDKIHTLHLLAGPNAETIYRMLLIKRNVKELIK